ncbi:MAG: glycerol transporter [Caeruleum heppii]|nr:MAG: glycerol transporter [Caeruleum heppii]
MSWMPFLAQLYSLDTLDTRFTTTSSTPPQDHPLARISSIDPTQSPQAENGLLDRTSKDRPRSSESSDVVPTSRWRTIEFYVYYLVFGTAVPMMFFVAYQVSRESHPEYPRFARLLSPGWIAGRMVDNSDSQYASFRRNVPYMLLLLFIHPLVRRLYQYYYARSSRARPGSPRRPQSPSEPRDRPVSLTQADARLEERASFDFIFALAFICALHGVSAVKILAILYANYSLATRLRPEAVPTATWLFNIAVLFANELCRGYRFSAAAVMMQAWLGSTNGFAQPNANWGAYIDSYGGLIPRWEILFNITVLRLISFNIDYYWSLTHRGGSPVEKKQLDPSNLPEKDRIAISARAADYGFRNYVAYALYSPLYLTGPILTFNDYISQLRYAPSSIAPLRTSLYGIRFFVTLLAMEVILHFIYAVAISKSQPTWTVYTPFQLSMLGYFNLHIIWLKLLLPWRFFRLWALIDGIDPPENMVRCMSNNYSAAGFWRGWHRSFNRWIVRYIYIPLGGSGGPGSHGIWGQARAVLNFLAVFTFVALWHDINLKLLIWGWLITLFILPEILASYLFPERKWAGHPDVYRAIRGVGAVGNILMMMTANLVGFAVGIDGIKGLVHGIVGTYSGLVFLGTACIAIFVAAQVMFEIRAQELRKGIQLKC